MKFITEIGTQLNSKSVRQTAPLGRKPLFAFFWPLQNVADLKMEQDDFTCSQSPSQYQRAGFDGREGVVLASIIFTSPGDVLLEC